MNEHLNRNCSGTPVPGSSASTVVIRVACVEDATALARLAQLDGRRGLEHSRLLVAEVDGELLAALPLDGGDPLADPFRPTESLTQMLKLRAAQLRAAPPRRGLRGWLARTLRTKARSRPVTAPTTPGNSPLLIPRD